MAVASSRIGRGTGCAMKGMLSCCAAMAPTNMPTLPQSACLLNCFSGPAAPAVQVILMTAMGLSPPSFAAQVMAAVTPRMAVETWAEFSSRLPSQQVMRGLERGLVLPLMHCNVAAALHLPPQCKLAPVA